MIDKIRSIIVVCVLSIFVIFITIFQIVSPSKEISDSERRLLQAMPDISKDRVWNGKFMNEFEAYSQDQFPYRDAFRAIKTGAASYLFGAKQVHDLYNEDGYLVKMEYPYSEAMIKNATDKFGGIYDKFLKGTNVKIYSAVVPDKNYFLAQKSGHLALNYDLLESSFVEQTPYMEYIDIFHELTIEDYYKTDTHWRQESILPVARKLCNTMSEYGLKDSEYETATIQQPFYGVYVGQYALKVKPDQIKYLTNTSIEQCVVTSYDTGAPKESQMYNFDKLKGKDPYEFFLSGSDALLVIDNPGATTDKELVIFRDSFGSSLAPLMIDSYSKITLVDIRYIKSDMLGYFLEFDNQDVLFIYSTLVLNNSTSFK